MKAAIGFKWILVVIAGFFILLFFYTLSMKQIKMTNKEVNIAVSSRIALILRELQGKGYTYTRAVIPSNKAIISKCIDHTLYITMGDSLINIPGAIPFMPPRVKQDVYFVTADLDVPFSIGKGVAIIDASTKLKDDYGLNYPKELTSCSSNCICINSFSSGFSSDCKERVSIDEANNKVVINGKAYPFVGKGMLKLAILEGNNYECTIPLIQNRTVTMALILRKKINDVYSSLDCVSDPDCCFILRQANDTYNLIISTNGNLSVLSSQYLHLKQLQRQAYIKNCPDIY